MSATQRTALALFIGAFLVYNFPLAYDLIHKPFFGWVAGQDVVSTTFLPLALFERGDFTLAQYENFFRTNWRSPYFIADVNGQIVSRYPVIGAVLALPFYGVPLGTGWIANPQKSWLQFPWSVFFPGKVAAATLTALAVVMFFFCARALTDRATSAALAIGFGFATSVWSTASQGLWQHTPSILLQLIALWFILRGTRGDPRALAPGAFFLSAATMARQSVGLTALVWTLYVVIAARPAIWRWIVWAIPPVLLTLAYNATYNGSPFVFGYQDGVAEVLRVPRVESIAGLLISPSRGLLVYSPFFIFVLCSFKNFGARRLFYFFTAITFGLGFFLLASFEAWDGGWGYGTRLLTDVLPYAMFWLIPAYTQLRGAGRTIFWSLAGFALMLQSFGLWDYGARWHWHWENYHPDFWNIARNEPWFYLNEYAAMAQHFFRVYFGR